MGDEATVSSTAEVEHAEPEPAPEVRYGFAVKSRVEHVEGASAPLLALPGAALFATGTWTGDDREVNLRDDSLLDHSWTSGLAATIDLGFAQLDAHADYGHVETALGLGDYTDVGLVLRWRQFSISIARREWRGDPLPGEADAITIMLGFGFTW